MEQGAFGCIIRWWLGALEVHAVLMEPPDEGGAGAAAVRREPRADAGAAADEIAFSPIAVGFSAVGRERGAAVRALARRRDPYDDGSA